MMIPWVITALVIICLVLTVTCTGLMWYVHELRADLDLSTRHLVSVLEQYGDPQKLMIGLNGSRRAGRLPPGHPH